LYYILIITDFTPLFNPNYWKRFHGGGENVNVHKPTIVDIAKVTGFSKSTVSRVLNNHPNVRASTRKKVLNAIESTGFSPNLFAQGLKTNRRQQIALAIDDIQNPYYPEVAAAAEQVAKQNGFRLVLFNHYGNPHEELSIVKNIQDLHVDGMILSPLGFHPKLTKAIKSSPVPISVIGVYLDQERFADEVTISKPEGLLAMEHLIRIGCRNIAYAGGPKDMHGGTRYGAYESSLKEHLLTINPNLVYCGDSFSLKTGFDAAEYFLSLPNLPDGLYAGSDIIAIGLMRKLQAEGVRIPDDISIVGVDDIPWCEITTPMLTSVSQLGAEAGRLAAELLCKRIHSNGSIPFQKILLEPRLIIRESTVKVMKF
jgi:DNA-binding LacI/PurR family transcriptional regulator